MGEFGTPFDIGGSRHPFCICGPINFSDGVMGEVTVEGCRAYVREAYNFDPHLILNADDVKELVSEFRERLGITEVEPAGQSDG